MKEFILFLLLLNLVVFSLAEKLEKIEGTSGEYSDIVVDSDGRWYVIRDKALHNSMDEGKTLNKIELPSKEPVYKGIGIDQFDNIYIQNHNLSIFIIAPTVNESLVIEEITLKFGKEKLVSKPFALGDNIVQLATKSGVTQLENSALVSKKKYMGPNIPKEITGLVRYNVSERFGDDFEEMFYGIKGDVRSWIYVTTSTTSAPLCQTKGPVKHLSAINNRVYFTVEGENDVKVIDYVESPHHIPKYHRKITYATIIEGIKASDIDDDSDFTIFSRVNDYKTYIYANSGNSGIVYGLDTFFNNGKNITQVVTSDKLDNVRILCSVVVDDKLLFGTSDGIYELRDIEPSRVLT